MRLVIRRIPPGNAEDTFEVNLDHSDGLAASGGTNDQGGAEQCRDSGAGPRVADLQRQIAERTQIPEWAQRLFYKGKYIRVATPLVEQGIPLQDATLLLATSAHYCDPNRPVQGTPGAASSSLAASPNLTDPATSSSASAPAGAESPSTAPTVSGDAVTSVFAAADSAASVGAASVGATALGGNVATAPTSAARSTVTEEPSLADLSVSEMKQRLRDLGVSYEGCTEKADLLELLQIHNRPGEGAGTTRSGTTTSNTSTSAGSTATGGGATVHGTLPPFGNATIPGLTAIPGMPAGFPFPPGVAAALSSATASAGPQIANPLARALQQFGPMLGTAMNPTLLPMHRPQPPPPAPQSQGAPGNDPGQGASVPTGGGDMAYMDSGHRNPTIIGGTSVSIGTGNAATTAGLPAAAHQSLQAMMEQFELMVEGTAMNVAAQHHSTTGNPRQ
eukprot:TRINITY_DN21756_c0_g1_i2.p1 TRINITY_DN21756_c0_g1~~TRINITY_DN21756_c0_g1_i2.p1  ORF type:complete len:447 (-),score=80.45 TRINITY_DN21756_c0_g1_i2:279-1619(-)